jgi:threonine aldolase
MFLNEADFRSDTVTRPTPGMLAAMHAAPVGDDVLGDDPTVKALEASAAERFGQEAGLFCPSGTMTNQIAINVHCRPGDEVICSPLAHIYNYEGGGVAFNSGVQVRTGGDAYGRLFPEDVHRLVQPNMDVHAAPTSLLVVENTANKGGGTSLGLPLLRDLHAAAKVHQLAYHLDGARVFNALVREGESMADYAFFDSISICLSKGLGAPVGSLLLGPKDFIAQARRIRKRFGGGMRQAGYLAAAGLYALDHHVDRLAEDHEKAADIDACLASLPYVVERKPCHTNMVLFRIEAAGGAPALQEHLADQGIRIIAMDREWLRVVTHLDIQAVHIDQLKAALRSFPA